MLLAYIEVCINGFYDIQLSPREAEMANLLVKAIRIAREESLYSLIKRICRYIYRKSCLEALEVPIAICLIKMRRFTNVDEALDFVYRLKIVRLNIKPMQIREEIRELLNILRLHSPRNIMEIGTAGGGTLFLFCTIASQDATIISVDLPRGPFGGGYPRYKIPLYKSFAKEDQKLYLIRADSHNPKTLETVKRIPRDKKLDFLFIDGDHTYEGVKKDFEMYSPLVRKGGIIAFHDICPGPEGKVGRVPVFWNEIKHSFTYKEIVKDWGQGCCGIGIIYI